MVDIACNGEVAIEQFSKNLKRECKSAQCASEYKLIVMDLGMPIKDGFEASSEILKLQKE